MKYPNPDNTLASGAAVIPMTQPYRHAWNARVKELIKHHAYHRTHFTVDDITSALLHDGYTKGNIGPHLRTLAKGGWITATNRYYDNGNGPKRIWASNVTESLAS